MSILQLHSSFVASEQQGHEEKGMLAEEWMSPKLGDLAARLRSYRAPSSLGEDDAITARIGIPASEAPALPTKRRAAVLVCLYQGAEGELRVILTKRAARMTAHSGEVALPGGKRDEGDINDIATALREADEEIGMVPSHVRVVTLLQPFLSKNLLAVIPVVGLLDDVTQFKPVPSPREVESIFDAPLEMFLKDEKHWFQDREWMGVKYRVHFFDYITAKGEPFLVWGLTASILIRAATVVYGRKPDYLEVPADFAKLLTFARSLECNPTTKADSTSAVLGSKQ